MKKNFAAIASLMASFLAGSGASALVVGQPAPDAGAKNQDGKMVRLADFRGKYLLVYFYPKDNTPGCTIEAQGLRDEFAQLTKLGAAVVGVSRQDEQTHRGFRDKHKLPFDLLADVNGDMGRALDVGAYPIVGLSKRQSVLIGPDGVVVRFYSDVEPSKHAAEVLADIEKAKAATGAAPTAPSKG